MMEKIYMDKKDLATGCKNPETSWQQVGHTRFIGEPNDPSYATARNRELEDARIGKTIIQSFTDGTRATIEHYGTKNEIRHPAVPILPATQMHVTVS